jgi:hypothetical protein
MYIVRLKGMEGDRTFVHLLLTYTTMNVASIYYGWMNV